VTREKRKERERKKLKKLQILHLRTICKGYLQACNPFIHKWIDAKSLQMADKMRKKLLVRARKEGGLQGKLHAFQGKLSAKSEQSVRYRTPLKISFPLSVKQLRFWHASCLL